MLHQSVEVSQVFPKIIYLSLIIACTLYFLIFYNFVVSQYRESGVHFIKMYEFVYNIKWNGELLFYRDKSTGPDKSGLWSTDHRNCIFEYSSYDWRNCINK